jgi:undecaprenyl phosphate N,N'-diacetylbacillosamine 1-phosphate transferase
MYRRYGKRALDLVMVVPAILVLLPLLLLLVMLVRLDSPGPIFFAQRRLGWGGRVFKVYKFRTMTNRERVVSHEIFGRDPEVTRFGYWMRRMKLDELPQLFNILSGDMSLVGPRPALPVQLESYNEVARRRLEVRPGLTGMAQVHGNIHLSWPERWQYDALYVDRLSFFQDVWIILRTVAVVLLGEGRFIKPARPEAPKVQTIMSSEEQFG